MSGHQSLQEFFDSPPAMAADYNLSASYSEPVTPEELIDIAPEAEGILHTLHFNYPRRHGPVDLRDAVAGRYGDLSAEQVFLTSGLDESLGHLFLAMIEPGDRVVVLTPCYPPHLTGPAWRGAEVVPWAARPEHAWVPDLDALDDLLRTPTRLVIATFPQNPTGFMPDDAYATRLIEIIEARGTRLISDEIYAGLPGGADLSGANLVNRSERVLSIHGLSKTVGMPGLRFGWTACRDPDVAEAIRSARNHFNCYVPTPVEALARIVLGHEDALIERATRIRAASLDAANAFFGQHANLFQWTAPESGVLSFPRWTGPGGAKALSDRLVTGAKLTLAPSTCFEAGDHHVRIGLGRRTTPAALTRLAEFLETAL